MPETEIEQAVGATAVGEVPSMPEGELKWIPVERLYESPWNPRQFYPEHEMAALVDSMRASGYRDWLPLMVRPLPSRLAEGIEQFGEFFEIGAGHRRSRAARIAGIELVPCVVRDLSDEEFLEILNFDNSARSDVHPLHEAAGWNQWMEKTGKGVLDIAARIGQSKEYVYQRLKYASLITEAKQAFLNGDITSGHAILIARLQPKEQAVALKLAVTPGYGGMKPGVRELGNCIQRDVHLDLERACFDLASVDLVAHAGSCDACPKRTKNSPELLPVAPEEGEDPADECTDPGCFHGKISAQLVQIEKQFSDAGTKLLKISRAYGKPKKGVDHTQNDFQVVPQDASGARPAVWIDGGDTGRVVFIKLHDKASGENSNRTQGSPATSRVSPEAAKQQEEKRKALLQRELAARRAILDAIRAKVSGVSRGDLEALLCFELLNCEGEVDLERMHKVKLAYTPELPKQLSGLPERDIFQLIVEIPLLGNLDQWSLNSEPKELLAAAKRYKVDAAAIRKAIEKPETAAPADKKPPVVPKAASAAKKKKAAPKPVAAKKPAQKPAAKGKKGK